MKLAVETFYQCVKGALLTIALSSLGASSLTAQSTRGLALERVLPYGSDDFCAAVNRTWLDTTLLPANRPWLSEYVEDYDTVQRRLQLIVESATASQPGSRSLQNVVRLYESLVNETRRNTSGLQPLSGELALIKSMRTKTDVARLMARFNRIHRDLTEGSTYPSPTPFLIEVWGDPTNSKQQAVHLIQSGLGLPGRNYYLGQESRLTEVRQKYRAHIQSTLELAEVPNASDEAASVIEIEAALAKFQSDFLQKQDPNAVSHKFSLVDLMRLAPDFDWSSYFREAAIDLTSQIVIQQPSYVRSATDLLANLSYEKLQSYFRWQLLRHYAMYLNASFADSAFDFYRKTLLGFSEQETTGAMALAVTQNYLGDELAGEYVARYFPLRSKMKVQAIAENVRLAYEHRIEANTWLHPDTRDEALRKLKAMRIEVGFPDRVNNVPQVRLRSDRLIDNLMLLSDRAYKVSLSRLRKPTDRSRWWVSPVSTSGTYSTTSNTLIIAAGRLLPPLFDSDADDSENYGGVGTLIGHEMGHALDNQGSEFDSKGTLRDWWSPADRIEFKRRTERLIAQYSRFEPLPGIHVDGAATLSENIADLAGLTMGYEALQLVRQSQSTAFTADDKRKFFESWARRWRVQYTEPLLVRVLKTDTHPPLQYRCIAPLSNFTPFYDSIGISRASSAYIANEDRISVW